jgi:hypothetical protein
MGNTQTGGNRHHAIAMGGFNEAGAQQTFRRIGEDRRSGTERSDADGRGDHGAEKSSHHPDEAQLREKPANDSSVDGRGDNDNLKLRCWPSGDGGGETEQTGEPNHEAAAQSRSRSSAHQT